MKRKQIKIYDDELQMLRLERLSLREEAKLHNALRAALKVLVREWKDTPETTVSDCIADVKQMLGE